MTKAGPRGAATPTSPAASRSTDAQASALKRLSLLARLLDARFGIPGTRWRFGFDSLVGLVPGLGDAAMAAFAGYIIFEARRLGASQTTLVKMVWNVVFDLAVGAIPVLGDLFDFYWKANLRNIELLRRDLERQRRE